jgi:hypothetical protein
LPNALNKLTHTHTHKIRVYSQKKSFKLYPEGYLVEWWIMHLFSFESASSELNFCYLSLNFGCGYFPGKAQSSPQYWRVFCILPKVLSFYLCCSPSWSILLVRKPCRCPTSLIPRDVSHTFAPLPKPERLSFTPDRVTQGSLGDDQAPLLPLKAGLLFKPRFLSV